MRIELTHKGFADLSLTTWVPRPNVYRTAFCPQKPEFPSHPDSIGRRRFYRPRKIRVSSGSYQGTTYMPLKNSLREADRVVLALRPASPAPPMLVSPTEGSAVRAAPSGDTTRDTVSSGQLSSRLFSV